MIISYRCNPWIRTVQCTFLSAFSILWGHVVEGLRFTVRRAYHHCRIQRVSFCEGNSSKKKYTDHTLLIPFRLSLMVFSFGLSHYPNFLLHVSRFATVSLQSSKHCIDNTDIQVHTDFNMYHRVYVYPSVFSSSLNAQAQYHGGLTYRSSFVAAVSTFHLG